MRRVLLSIFSLIVVLSLTIWGLLYFLPGLILDFEIYPEGLESYDKDIFLTVNIFPWKNIQLTNDQRYKSHLEWSPHKKYLAFYENIRGSENWSYDKEWLLKVINPKFFKIKTVFVGTYKTSGYSWLDDGTIRVYVDAGTGVRVYRDIDINIPAPFIASEHMSPEFWVPEKTF